MGKLIAYLVCLAVAGIVALAFAPRDALSVTDSALNTERMQINGLLNLRDRQLAVGERGAILLSDDQGRTWQQATVEPQRNLSLTGITALTAAHLVAVGQDGWIVRSTDGGSTWQEVQYDAEAGEPLLGAWAASDEQVFVFGSYGRFYRSDDGGQHWQAEAVDVDRSHLNAMDGDREGRRLVVGEQGLVLRSSDHGQHWHALPKFYNGSLFGVARLSADSWVAYGMRGHVFVTHDFGSHWQGVDTGSLQPLYGHVQLPDHAGVLIVGAGSSWVRLDGQGKLLGSGRQPGLGTLTSAMVMQDGQVRVAGERGVMQATGNSVATVGKEGLVHDKH
ncbi:WD40/YVTN/BNR-like repeat-containing protein [Pseudomonas sp. NPDC089396]|uniref:WD40/YVTN/BNR-like repeat-containing protein n=1 Tax=Pseudomonas sp. NPDC089396 TaxID=3364461 RepID=UPI0038391D1A